MPVANGGTNCSSASITCFNNITGLSASGTTGTTSTNLVFSTSPTFITPVLGTPTSVTLTNGTGLPISTGVSGLGTPRCPTTLTWDWPSDRTNFTTAMGTTGTPSSTTYLRGDNSWATAGGGSPGGVSGDVQCNVSSAFGACDTGVFTYASHIVTFNTANSNANSALTLDALAPTQASTSTAGNNLVLAASNATAGSASAAAAGGAVTVTAGNAATFAGGTVGAAGGAVTLTSGNATVNGATIANGGAINLNAGSGANGGGSSGAGSGGAITLTGGRRPVPRRAGRREQRREASSAGNGYTDGGANAEAPSPSRVARSGDQGSAASAP